MHMVGERLGRVMDSASKKIPEIFFNILSKPATSRVARVLGCDEWETVFKPIAGHLILVGGGPNDQMHPAVKEYFAKSMWMYQQPGDKCRLEAIDLTSSAVKEFIKPDELAKRVAGGKFGPLFALVLLTAHEKHAFREALWQLDDMAQVSLPELLQPSLKDLHTGQWEALRDIDKKRTASCYFMPEVQRIHAPYTQHVMEMIQSDMCTLENFVLKNCDTIARIRKPFRGLNVWTNLF